MPEVISPEKGCDVMLAFGHQERAAPLAFERDDVRFITCVHFQARELRDRDEESTFDGFPFDVVRRGVKLAHDGHATVVEYRDTLGKFVLLDLLAGKHGVEFREGIGHAVPVLAEISMILEIVQIGQSKARDQLAHRHGRGDVTLVCKQEQLAPVPVDSLENSV